MKILLILPAADHLRVSLNRPDQVPRRSMLRFSILPLTTVAALTPRSHSVKIVDENVEPVDIDADVDVVGISFMTALADRAHALADAFQARGRIVVAGGYHPTFRPGETSRHFDAVVCGEAEGLWQQVLSDIEAGCLKKVYRSDSLPDLTDAPIPRRDLVLSNAHHYVTSHAIQTGRGCGHRCRYCSITAFHRGVHRSRPLDRVLHEVRQVPRNFMFVDDNIIADRRYARALFEAMIPLNKRWVSQCSIEIADDRGLLDLARRAGCRGLFVGIETTNARNLEAVDKGFNRSSNYNRRIAAIRRKGIGVIAGMIVGMDNDDRGVFERTLRFLDRSRIDALQLNIMTPLPGTPLFDHFDRQGRIIDRNWSRYDFRHTVIAPRMMTARELQAGADWLYSRFYRLDRIVLRSARALFSLGPVSALLVLRLNMTYRYDNIREGVVGWNPSRKSRRNRFKRIERRLRVAWDRLFGRRTVPAQRQLS